MVLPDSYFGGSTIWPNIVILITSLGFEMQAINNELLYRYFELVQVGYFNILPVYPWK